VFYQKVMKCMYMHITKLYCMKCNDLDGFLYVYVSTFQAQVWAVHIYA